MTDLVQGHSYSPFKSSEGQAQIAREAEASATLRKARSLFPTPRCDQARILR